MGRHGAALQLLGMKWRPEASYEGPGIPLRGRTFLRKALLHPAAIVFRVVAPCSKARNAFLAFEHGYIVNAYLAKDEKSP